MSRMLMPIVDRRMWCHRDRLVRDVGIKDSEVGSLGTSIFDEVRRAGHELARLIRDSSPVDVQRRMLFFEDYNVWDVAIRPFDACPSREEMAQRHGRALPTKIVRRTQIEMHLVIHLYSSFVYPGDGLFEVLKKKAPSGSCVRKCCRYVRDNPMRAMRHAVAHGNWQLADPIDDSIDFWARKGDQDDEPLEKYNVNLSDLTFFLDLTWCVPWAAYTAVTEGLGAIDAGL